LTAIINSDLILSTYWKQMIAFLVSKKDSSIICPAPRVLQLSLNNP
jgi:hypothetical protein